MCAVTKELLDPFKLNVFALSLSDVRIVSFSQSANRTTIRYTVVNVFVKHTEVIR